MTRTQEMKKEIRKGIESNFSNLRDHQELLNNKIKDLLDDEKLSINELKEIYENVYKAINNKKIKIIEENIKKYGEATLYLFDYDEKDTNDKEKAEYMFNSNKCRKTIFFEDYYVYQDVKSNSWFGNYNKEGKTLMWLNNNALINDIKRDYNYGENHKYGDEDNIDTEMDQIFEQIESKY